MANSTYDLTALSERLFSEGRLKPLAGKIRRAQHMASLQIDLTIALESMDALKALMATRQQYEFDRTLTEFALLCNALVHYARATKTHSEERPNLDLRSKFNPQQKTVHQELIDLRDKAIAHFGSGGSYQGIWQNEFVVLQGTGHGARVGVATRRQTRDRELVSRARTQIESARHLVSEISARRIDQVTAELNRLDPNVVEVELLQHVIDLDEVMGSSDVGEEIRSSAVSGENKKGVLDY